jgi:ATP/maltotriose-dependent transcriptional regulator MalT/DNA-binding SARP family transcriptional activator
MRFTLEEVEAVFAQIWRLALAPATARELATRTEGWVTGLRLACEALRDLSEAEARAYVERLGGSGGFIHEYLAAEVYARQPEALRVFLRRTSVLSTFDAPTAAAVSNMSEAERLIRALEEARLFLVHLDSGSGWFRYHHLFGDFLRRTLVMEEGLEGRSSCHRRAATWLEQHDDPAGAVEHALQAGDLEVAIRLLRERGVEMLARGFQARVEHWIRQVPTEMREADPGLLALRGDLADLVGDWPRALRFYERAIQAHAPGRRETLAVMESLILCYTRYGGSDRLLALCRDALDACPSDDDVQRASLSAWLGATLIFSGRDWDEGYALIREAHPLAFRSGDPRAIGWACVIYGFVWHFPRGNFHHAETAFNEGITLLRSLGWSPMLYQLVMNKCLVLTFRGHLDRALDEIEETLALAEENGHAFVVAGLEMCRALALFERGDLERCGDSFARLSDRLLNAQTRAWYHRTLMLLHARRGNLDLAQVAAEEMLRALALSGRGLYAPECLISLGAYHLIRGDAQAAQEALLEALALSLRARARYWEMRAHLHLAAALQPRDPRAREHLEAALRLTRENDYADAWLVPALGVAVPMLVEAVAAHIEEELARSLLARFGDRLADLLIPLTTSSRGAVRAVALEYLGRVASVEAGHLLRDARRDRSKHVRRTVARTLRGREPAPFSLEIVTLGRFQVRRDGHSVDCSRRLQARIFKFLIAHYDGSVTAEMAIEAFWPDLAPEKAKRNLIVHINQIRRLLLPAASSLSSPIVHDGSGYRLRLGDGVTLDAAEFERLFDEAGRARRRGDLEEATALLVRAEGVYQGPFLPGDPYDDWLRPRRERLASACREALFFLAERASGPAGAAERYRRALVLDPLDEGALQGLLRACLALGDRSAAVREFESFARSLREALDEEPSSQTRALLAPPLRGATGRSRGRPRPRP